MANRTGAAGSETRRAVALRLKLPSALAPRQPQPALQARSSRLAERNPTAALIPGTATANRATCNAGHTTNPRAMRQRQRERGNNKQRLQSPRLRQRASPVVSKASANRKAQLVRLAPKTAVHGGSRTTASTRHQFLDRSSPGSHASSTRKRPADNRYSWDEKWIRMRHADKPLAR